MRVSVASRYANFKQIARWCDFASSSDLLETVMDTKDEIRRRRLKELCGSKGGVRAVAEKANVNWQSLDQILKGVLLPEKANGERSARALGDPLARKIEQAYDLGEGWFDWPFPGVDFKRWSALGASQRNYVVGRLAGLIEEAERLPPDADEPGKMAEQRQAAASKKKTLERADH